MNYFLKNDRKVKRMDNLEDLMNGWGIKHFAPIELCRHKDQKWVGNGMRRIWPPATRLQPNIEYTLKLADDIREQWGGPVKVVSGYRCPLYNEVIGGAESSMHTFFRAMDIQPIRQDMHAFEELVKGVVAEKRENGLIVGLGVYNTFCHIDTGFFDYNRDWSFES